MSEDSVVQNKRLKAQEQLELSVKKNWPAFGVIGAGVILLLSNVFGFHLIDFLWPMFIIGPGILLMMPAHQSTEEHQSGASFLAVPGAIFATVGLLLFAMNITDHFEAWAYSWTLVFAAVPAALMYIKRFEPEHRIHETGHKIIRTLFYMFLGFAVFFEIIIFENFNPIFPLGLIGLGIYLLIQNRQDGELAN
ncbi:MAG: hypothetical protein AAF490_19565 [Chloroflexota bacterium]